MARHIFTGVSCFFLISVLPAVAKPPPPPPPGPHRPPHVAPAPEADVGLLSLAMVGAAAALVYWRKRKS
jgi:hypothetical protein